MESEERATEVGETDNWITSSGVILLICLYQGLGLDSSPSPQSPVLSAAGVCVLDGVLYCVGGWSNTGAVKTVERYNDLLTFFSEHFFVLWNLSMSRNPGGHLGPGGRGGAPRP